ncbi:ELWxxDGT repeat protein [Dyadobacter sp. NIV53]|uniref:ELWxxDGT repeat protein n=1 Tax=Dyadobacter sp. NIV53 TaxID=2861765 RepID=UPI001C882AB6|nr:ELWxxDGT repeat protein [Dyadobacter sp. NIV53]
MKKNYLCLVLLSLLSIVSKAQTIDLVKDINTEGTYRGIRTKEAVTAGGLYFALAYDEINKLNLWRSDGTAAGTYVLTELPEIIDVPPKNLTAAGTNVFFVALYDGRYWLFRSDGTKSGTLPLHPVYSSAYEKLDIFEYKGAVYFSAYDGTTENLWKTNGTVTGTVKVKSFPSAPFGSTGPYDFFQFNGFMYFLIQTGSGQNATYRLWKSDGTTTATVSGPVFSSSFKPVVLNGYMYYSDGKTLMRTDGNTVTTIKGAFATAGSPVLAGSTIYFPAGQQYTDTELWKSDGTTSGTVRVKDIYSGAGNGSEPTLLTNVNGTLFFAARTSAEGYELWKSNGSDAGTVLVSDLDPAVEVQFDRMFAIGKQAVFLTGYGSGQTLWKSNGTNTGTQKVAEFPVSNPVNVSGNVFFNGVSSSGSQLYKSDFIARTIRITTLFPPGSYPGNFANFNGVRYMPADDGINGRELWKTDGTSAGTVLVKDVIPGQAGSNPEQLTKVNGNLFFVSNEKEIWKTNGTAAGTVLVKNVVQAASDHIEGLIDVNGVLYFGVVSSGGTLRLWKCDGTAAGTVQVTSFPSTPGFKPAIISGQLVFPAWDGTDSYELWKTTGTAAGTTIIKNIGGQDGANTLMRFGATILNGFLYYTIENPAGLHLVRTDGTTTGTVIVKSLYSMSDAYVGGLTQAGGLLYFSAYEYSGDSQEFLWRTDGTSAGTFRLAGFDGHPDISNYISGGTYAAGLFYFIPFDPDNGDQLWVSNGTAAGTRLVKEIGALSGKSDKRLLTAVGNIAYFTASDQVHGKELWQTDGSDAGTSMVQDFNLNGSSGFNSVTNYNGTLLMSANNGSAGAELYRYQALPPASLRINAGGAAFTASAGRSFSADQYFSDTTQLSGIPVGDILNTADDQLYREQRFGSTFQYKIPVANGQVSVVLHFAELFWGVPGKGGSAGTGKRRFHVDMEGARKLTNYDIFSAAGGAMRARTETFTVNVTDGILNINFLTGAADKPIIAAIEVVPTQLVLGPLGDATVRNTPNNETNFGTLATLEVKTGSLASYERNAYLKFSLAGISQVGSAKLRLYGSNVQNSGNVSLAAYGVPRDSWAETGITWSNAPFIPTEAIGSVNVNNAAKYYEIDVTAFVKSELAGDKIVTLFITNPTNQNIQLTFNSRENTANPPQLIINAVSSPAVRAGAEDDMTEVVPKTQIEANIETEFVASSLYPNPAGKRFTVNVSGKHKGNVDLQLINLSGKTFQVQSWQATAPASLHVASASLHEVDVTPMQLSKGIYIMKIQSKTFTETIKVLLTE